MLTSSAAIARLTEKASGAQVATQTRLVAGEVNEVWAIETTNHQDLIARISHREDVRFESERWALDAAREVGLPTPKVLLIEKFEDGDKTKTACVQVKLSGQPLDKIDIPAGRQTVFAKRIADALELLHTVKLGGFSYILDETGRTTKATFADFMLDTLEEADDLRAVSRSAGFNGEQVETAFDLLKRHEKLYVGVQATLTHGDFGADHLFFNDDGNLTGIIDMEGAMGGDVTFDLAWWDFYYQYKIPTAAITEQMKSFTEEQQRLVWLQGLRLSLYLMRYYYGGHDKPRQEPLELVRANMVRYINSLTKQ